MPSTILDVLKTWGSCGEFLIGLCGGASYSPETISLVSKKVVKQILFISFAQLGRLILNVWYLEIYIVK